MTEEDAEELEVEVVPKNELAIIIKETGLEPQLAQEFTINFEEHFKMASEWAKKAKKIIVTNENQLPIMQEARTARLFLRSKRLEIEAFRVARKEYYLKGGRAIDKVANFLKDTIIPIENYLDSQEHFVELRRKAEGQRILAEGLAKLEEERIAKEKAEAEEREHLRAENERLRNEQEKIKKENEAQIAKERAEQQEKLDLVRKEQAKVEEELRIKKQAELKAEADKIRAQEKEAQYGDNDWMIVLKNYLQKTPYPQVRSAENIRIIEDVKSYVGLAILKIKIIEEEE